MSKRAVDIIEWTPDCVIGVPQIDREHRTWFEMLNRLHAAMIDGRGVEHLQAVFQESAQFGFGHFAHEEELMTAARYPGLWEHTQLHNELRALGMEFVKRFEQGELTMTVALAVALLQRIKNHIITADCPMGAYLAAHGGPPAGT